MANCVIVGSGGGGALSSDVTAAKANVLAGTRTVTTDSGNAIVEGTMVNRGTVNHSLPINGSFTIAQGYHSGSGKVTQSITTKAAATYYATTSDQTISSGQYLSGAQTIKRLIQTNLSASNVKNGTTVKINNSASDVWSVTGTFAGNIKHMHVDAVYVPGGGSDNDQGPNAMTFTMPENGVVHYSGFSYKSNSGGSGGNHIQKNGVVIDNRDLASGDGWTYRGTMVMKSFNANKGDTIRIECSAGNVGTVFTFLDAVINY